jgi:hypothetical protein
VWALGGAIHSVTALGEPLQVGGIPHRRKGSRVFVILGGAERVERPGLHRWLGARWSVA